jgi:hypothetical protein
MSPSDDTLTTRMAFAYLEEVEALCKRLETEATTPTRLCVFDFDNTLFRSPHPNPQLWESHLVGQLVSQLGWFLEPRTLSSIEQHDTSWFISEVVHEVRTASADPHTITILLTGRLRTLFLEHIQTILAKETLTFDLVLLKEHLPEHQPTTMEFKRGCLQHLLERLPCIREIHIWEDRVKHVQQFTRWIRQQRKAGRLVDGRVIHIQAQFNYLPTHHEHQLVQALIATYNERQNNQPLRLHPVLQSAKLYLSAKGLATLYRLFIPNAVWPKDITGQRIPVYQIDIDTCRQSARAIPVYLTATRHVYATDRPAILIQARRPRLRLLYPLDPQLFERLANTASNTSTHIAQPVRLSGLLKVHIVQGLVDADYSTHIQSIWPLEELILEQHPHLYGRSLEKACDQLRRELRAQHLDNARTASITKVQQCVKQLFAGRDRRRRGRPQPPPPPPPPSTIP